MGRVISDNKTLWVERARGWAPLCITHQLRNKKGRWTMLPRARANKWTLIRQALRGNLISIHMRIWILLCLKRRRRPELSKNTLWRMASCSMHMQEMFKTSRRPCLKSRSKFSTGCSRSSRILTIKNSSDLQTWKTPRRLVDSDQGETLS